MWRAILIGKKLLTPSFPWRANAKWLFSPSRTTHSLMCLHTRSYYLYEFQQCMRESWCRYSSFLQVSTVQGLMQGIFMSQSPSLQHFTALFLDHEGYVGGDKPVLTHTLFCLVFTQYIRCTSRLVRKLHSLSQKWVCGRNRLSEW